ncbi:MAG: thrombospondin type 3 repeat-containing protein [Polyangiaceae bacterium]|nr:thrombospondin type 3 repeat-containing protein [Polyangiaceae bacterium]
MTRACDDDLDGDGVFNAVDNCPTVVNPDQKAGLGDKGEACSSGDLGELGFVDPAATGDDDAVSGGCGCALPGAGSDRSWPALLAAAAVGAIGLRRRRR